MKSIRTIIFGAVAGLTVATGLMAQQGTNTFADDKARVSYAIGMLTGRQWLTQDTDFNVDMYARGIKDTLAGGPALLTPEEAQAAIEAFKQKYTARQQQKRNEIASKNKAEGDAFLASNRTNTGVVVLPSGLQFMVLTNAGGTHPGESDIVTVHYRGTLLDGTEFDSSYKRNQPAQFPVNGVIRGWTEALQKMAVGSKWKLFIPSELAYGEPGRPGIPPNSVLIFEVELLDVKKTTPTPPPAPLTSDIIKVPSAEEMKKGAKIEVIKQEDAAKIQNGGK